MKKTIKYKDHEIRLEVKINDSIDSRNSKSVQTQTFTHALTVFVDNKPLTEEKNITDNDLLKKIEAATLIAQQRIDIIGTPADSPLVNSLLQQSFIM